VNGFTSSFFLVNFLLQLLGFSSGQYLERRVDMDVAVFWRNQALAAPRCSYTRIDCYNKALARDSGYLAARCELADVYYELGITYGHRDLFRAAADCLEAAAALEPDDPEIHRRLGRVYFLLRDFDGSRRELERTRALSPQANPVPGP